MFYCDYCKHISRSGETQTLVTTAVRRKTYKNNYRPSREELERIDYMPKSEESAGTEIVHQKKACERCAHSQKSIPPQLVQDAKVGKSGNVHWEVKRRK